MAAFHVDLRGGINRNAGGALASCYPNTTTTASSSERKPEFLHVRPPAAGITPPANRRLAVDSKKMRKKPEICTADELHLVSVPNSEWKLALWRYLPSPKAKRRNHPLLLLSGLATNAIGFDLSPESSFARFMAGQGFDTWILEVRGAGLSSLAEDFGDDSKAENDEEKVSISSNSQSKLVERFTQLVERVSDGFAEGQNSAVASVIRDLSQKLVNIIEESQEPVTSQFFDFQERFSTTLEDFIGQVDQIAKYDWDFDHYLQEDLPSAMEYIRTQCKPKDGKLLAIGHSMGGILLYAMLSHYCEFLVQGFQGRDSGFKSVVTLGSSLDYSCSRSSFKLFLPAADPAKALKVPVIPIGPFLAAVHPFVSLPLHVSSWLCPLVSAPGMMDPKLYEKYVSNGFCTVPAKLLLQLATAFHKGGLHDRNGTFCYKDHLGKSKVPVLAVAGDLDIICPPEAVYETVKIIPEPLVTYRVFGEPRGPHYAHYDLVGGHQAINQVYPCLINFLDLHDT